MNYISLFFEIQREFGIPPEKAQEALKICEGDYRTACEMLLDTHKPRVLQPIPPPVITPRRDTFWDKVVMAIVYVLAFIFFAFVAYVLIVNWLYVT